MDTVIEIRCRIGLAKVKFMERKKILTSKMNLDLRKLIVKYLVWCMQQRHGHYLKQIRKGSKLLKCGYGVDMENDGEDQLDSKSQQLRSSESSQ